MGYNSRSPGEDSFFTRMAIAKWRGSEASWRRATQTQWFNFHEDALEEAFGPEGMAFAVYPLTATAESFHDRENEWQPEDAPAQTPLAACVSDSSGFGLTVWEDMLRRLNEKVPF